MHMVCVCLMCLLLIDVKSFCKDYVGEHSLKNVMVPAGCTGQLQPLDVAINQPFKSHLKEIFSLWYAEKVKEQLDRGHAIENVKVDLRTSVIKSIHFQWLIKNMEWLSGQEEAALRGWKDTGILDKLSGN